MKWRSCLKQARNCPKRDCRWDVCDWYTEPYNDWW